MPAWIKTHHPFCAVLCLLISTLPACRAEEPRQDIGTVPDGSEASGGTPGDGGGRGEGGMGGSSPDPGKKLPLPSACESSEGGVDLECSLRMDCEEEGGETTCSCKEGFTGQRCDDIDECATMESPCGEAALCVNHTGGFSCVCESGYEPSEGNCVDIDECTRAAITPCAPQAECTNLPGSFACSCPEGTSGDGFFCKNAPACDDQSCSGAGSCLETANGYVCVCESGYAGQTDCQTTCDALQLPPALLEWVRLLIGKPEGTLYPEDVAHIESLNARGLALSSLDGLECWPGLRHLDLTGNALQGDDLTTLGQLNGLVSLRLDCNPIENLDDLGPHPTLRELSFSQNGPNCPDTELEGIEPLADLSGLMWLRLEGHGLPDVQALAGLEALRSLALSGNALDADDLSALGQLPALEELVARNNQIASWNFPNVLDFVRVLDVSNNSVPSLTGIDAARSLEVFTAQGLHITETAPLANLTRLWRLDLASNEIVSLEALEEVSELSFLNVRFNSIEDLSPLLSLELGTLLADENPFRCDPKKWQDQQSLAMELASRGTQVLATCTD